MFSVEEKQKIANTITDVIKEINHPEMNNGLPEWQLQVFGKEKWSYANIHPNHEDVKGEPNPWNEVAREVLDKEGAEWGITRNKDGCTAS